MYPNQDNHNDLKFFPFPNISEENLLNYLKYLTQYIKKQELFDKDHGLDFQECEYVTRNEYSGRFSC